MNTFTSALDCILISFSHHNSVYEWNRARLLHGSTNPLADLSKHTWIYLKLLLSLPLWESANCAAICSHPLAWHARTHFQTGMPGCTLHIYSHTYVCRKQRTHVLSHICGTQVLMNLCRVWKKGAVSLWYLYICVSLTRPPTQHYLYTVLQT